jgi:hypothetical protein
MGDRGNIVMIEEKGGEIYLYTHWYGSNLPKILQRALIRGKDRWDDEAYLARTIFNEMVKDDILGEMNGYGISTYETDNNHANIKVKSSTQTIFCGNEIYSFQEYITLENPLSGF